jgi:hypothetical protein
VDQEVLEEILNQEDLEEVQDQEVQDQEEVLEAMVEDLETEILAKAVETSEAVLRKALVHEKCTKLLVLSANRNVKFLSNQHRANQFIAENVLTKRNKNNSNLIYIFIYFIKLQ